ncbi:MAG: peptide chain release factor 2 [Myxococcota bacterium]
MSEDSAQARETQQRIDRLGERVAELRRHLDLAGKRERLKRLEERASEPEFWSDREEAQKLMRDKRSLERELEFFDSLEQAHSDAAVMLELAASEDDAGALREATDAAHALEDRLAAAELRRLLSGEHDACDAILSINAGAGGTEACDWANMLLRLYLRWAEAREFRSEILDIQAGEEAGIKSATLTVAGDHAYGWLRSEVGIHRLVRISPFDAQKRRHTSFASVGLLPDIGDRVEIEIAETDLRVDTYRAGGAGGQHVNRTDSAVRITHLPTGIVVQCQNERSQHKNKASAMKVLRARLFERAEAEQRAEAERLAGKKEKIDFGSQIRSYTLHPAQRVKDHRTGCEAGNALAVLDGGIDRFIRAYLLRAAEGSGD